MHVQAVYAGDVAVHTDGQNAADGPGSAAPADPNEPDAAAARDDKVGGHEQQQMAGPTTADGKSLAKSQRYKSTQTSSKDITKSLK
jgi:hypothetical protein